MIHNASPSATASVHDELDATGTGLEKHNLLGAESHPGDNGQPEYRPIKGDRPLEIGDMDAYVVQPEHAVQAAKLARAGLQ